MRSARHLVILTLGFVALNGGLCEAATTPSEFRAINFQKSETALPVSKWVKIGGHSYGLSSVSSGDHALFEYLVFGKTGKGGLPAGSAVLLSRHEMADIKQDQEVPGQDYTMNIMRSQKLVSSPSLLPMTSADGKRITGRLAFYSKRQATNKKGSYVPQRQLLRFAFDYEIDAATGELLGLKRSEILINRPFARASGDLGVFSEEGEVYLVSAATLEGNIVIYRLKEDLTDVEEFTSETKGHEDHREAPSVFKMGEMWYVHTSGTSGWRPNQHMYCYSRDLKGPWSDWLPIGDETGYHSQVFGTSREDGIRLFNGTRNSQLWGGAKNSNFPNINGRFQNVRLPVYFNTPKKLAVSFYNDVKGKGDSLAIGQKNEGRKLELANVDSSAGLEGLAALTDEDPATEWTSDTKESVLTFTLPKPRVVRAVKVHNRTFRDSYTRLMSAAKIELGDEQGNYTEIYNKWILQFTWLQSIPVPTKKLKRAKTVRITFLGSTTTSNDKKTNKWGFKEIEIWGGEPEPLSFRGISGASVRKFKPLAGTALTFTAGLPYGDESKIATSVTFVANAKSDGSGAGEKVCELYLTKAGPSSPLELSFREEPDSPDLQHITMVRPGQILKTVINTDSRTYDVLLDGKVVWGGAKLLSSGRFIESIDVSSSIEDNQNFPAEMSFGSK